MKEVKFNDSLPLCVLTLIKSFQTLAGKPIRPKILEFNTPRQCANWAAINDTEIQFMRPPRAQQLRNLDDKTYIVAICFKNRKTGLDDATKSDLILQPDLDIEPKDIWEYPTVAFAEVPDSELRRAKQYAKNRWNRK